MAENGYLFTFLKPQAPPASRSIGIIIAALALRDANHYTGVAYELTVVVGAGAGGLTVPGGLGVEPVGVVGFGGGGIVVDCRMDGRG